MRRADPDELLTEIIREATAALRKRNFAGHITEIHRRVHLLERRMRRWEEKQYWSEVEQAFEKMKDEV